jgi:NAD(P)-dependent dehydrogenase (short-subunit alcohol dehydrogenase family)
MFSYLLGVRGASGFGSATTADEVADAFADQISGRVFVVTGGNAGIGLECVVRLCQRGATVVMGSRSQTKMGEARQLVEQMCEGRNYTLHTIPLDLSSLASVEEFVREFHSLKLPLHCLINNAGVMACPLQLTTDGHEMQFGTNHLGHFKLTNLLANDLRKSAPSRVINLSSVAHNSPYEGGFRWDDLRGEQHYHKWHAYGTSKLANILHARELNRRFKAEGVDVTAYAVHPGVINTDLYRHLGGGAQVYHFLTSWVNKNVPQGAATSMYCALAPAAKEGAGGYFQDCNLVPEHAMKPFARSDDLAHRLWDVSVELTGTDLPRS